MKKQIFAFICIFMLMFNSFTYTETKAMDIGVAIDVGSDVLYYGWDMLNSLINGFTIGLSQYSGYADKASAMAAYYDDWGDVITVLTQGYLTPQEASIPAISLETVYPLDFGMSNAVMRDFINQYGGFVYDPSLGMYADINMKSIASWNRYQDSWIQRYIEAFNSTGENIQTFCPPEYQSYIDLLNTNRYRAISDLRFQDCSFIFGNVVNQGGGNYIFNNITQASSYNFYSAVFPNTFNVYLDNVDGSYYLTFTPMSENNQISVLIDNNAQYTFPCNYTGGYINFTGFGAYGTVPFSQSLSNGYYSTTFSNLTNALQFVSNAFAHVNLYVDGVLWNYAGTSKDPLITAPDHPILDENGQIIGNDVWFPEQDLKADLVKFTELIDDKILTGDTLTIDDVIDAGVLTDANGNIITQENRDEYLIKKSVSTVIADALENDPTAGFVPNVPNPPSDDPWNWQFPTIVIPEDGDSNPRSTGLSVLARIVNVTNQGLPAELITMFWGICITLLILGIIKILHK